MSKFEVGSRVGDIEPDDLEKFNEQEDTTRYGKVTDLLSNGKVRVEWDKEAYGDKVEECDPEDLYPEDELKAKVSALEEEFNAFAGKVEEKVGEAAKLLREAAALAKEHGHKLSDMDAADDMLGAMRAAGWRTSALYC